MIRLLIALTWAFTLLVLMSISVFLPTVARRPFPPEPPVETSVAPFTCYCDRGNVLNCSNFALQENAQSCFEQCIAAGFGDVNNLGMDSDGEACEHLPHGWRVVQ